MVLLLQFYLSLNSVWSGKLNAQSRRLVNSKVAHQIYLLVAVTMIDYCGVFRLKARENRAIIDPNLNTRL